MTSGGFLSTASAVVSDDPIGTEGGCPDRIQKQETGLQRSRAIPGVAGCTTSSLCPRCPYKRDEVLSLYLKPSFLLIGEDNNGNGHLVLYPVALCATKHINIAIITPSIGKVDRAGQFLWPPRLACSAQLHICLTCCAHSARSGFARRLERLALAIVFSAGDRIAWLRAPLTNFLENAVSRRRSALPRSTALGLLWNTCP